jgi:hydrogenase maturation protein HypF
MSSIKQAQQRAVISVQGVVQGVGFRPYIYRIAVKHRLSGWVRNTSGNVKIEVEGEQSRVEAFVNELKKNAPPQSRIERIEIEFAPVIGYSKFIIQQSERQQDQYQLVSPDIATCQDCQREIFDPADRRYRYSFTNCTNCGPRFTIIEDIPYDRAMTTMRKFEMCTQCEKEYNDPLDRRFHAQPNACPVCGPKLELVKEGGGKVNCTDVILESSKLLKGGKILAVRGLGGFQLACDATNDRAVKILRQRKHRPAKPFAVMISSIVEARKHCKVSDEEERLLKSPESPIVLLSWNKNNSNIVDEVAPKNNFLGVMLPYTPLHHLLLNEAGIPLVMTSGNLSEEPIAKDNEEALSRLHGIADYFVNHDRDIYARYDDSVFIAGDDGKPSAVRRARGYAPYPVSLPYNSRQILACGAELKNTFCLTRDNHAFISQHIGDMENEETLEHFENTVELYKRLFRIEPELIACDLHPEYLSSKYAVEAASEHKLPLVKVQHHHAHIVSCMVENNVRNPVIGVAFDGVGYGTDGTVWGGEFLVVDRGKFTRAGHLQYVPMPGGTAAIKKPYRMAVGYLHSLIGDIELPDTMNLLTNNELEIIEKQIQQNINCPLTSSMGRLFDAVAAIAGVRQEIEFEAQAAIELEMLAMKHVDGKRLQVYPFNIDINDNIRVINPRTLFKAVLVDVRMGISASEISVKLHNTVAKMTARVCREISKETGLKQVALSGGVFQNRLLLRLTRKYLEGDGFKVFTHHIVPCNDGGIALGQAVIANQVK